MRTTTRACAWALLATLGLAGAAEARDGDRGRGDGWRGGPARYEDGTAFRRNTRRAGPRRGFADRVDARQDRQRGRIRGGKTNVSSGVLSAPVSMKKNGKSITSATPMSAKYAPPRPNKVRSA